MSSHSHTSSTATAAQDAEGLGAALRRTFRTAGALPLGGIEDAAALAALSVLIGVLFGVGAA